MSISNINKWETDMIGKIVNLNVYNEHRLSGKLTNHKPNLYQVTNNEDHFVFWEYEVTALHWEESSNTLTIFI